MASDSEPRYRDRRDAGRRLGLLLQAHGARDDVIVLGLPRGGVEVAFEVAAALNAQLDICVVRKLGVPGFEELAMGAVAVGGVRVLNQEIVARYEISEDALEVATDEETVELKRREAEYRCGRPPAELRGKIVIVVDDGLATGATMRAAVTALRSSGVSRCVVAVPVASKEALALLQQQVDEVICPLSPDDFAAVGAYYDDFSQTTDADVQALLRETAPGG